MKKINIKKPDIAKSFKSKKSRYGGYSTLITAVFIAILIVVNLIAGQLNLKADLTKNKIYSLSKSTYQTLGTLNKDIKIYAFFTSGNEDSTIKTILGKYASGSKKISVQFVDPNKYPGIANQFSSGEQMQSGTVVVSSGSKYKLIQASDMFNYSYDESGNEQVDSLAIEQKVTGAIVYVTSENTPVIYTLTGHGETALPSQITNALNTQNYTTKDLNLLAKDTNLASGNVILINGPTRDLSSDETKALKDFLSKGGRAIFLMGLVNNDLPNFQSVLNGYGVEISKAIVVEGSSSNSSQNPMILIPNLQSHDILTPLISSNIPVLIPGSQVIKTLSVKKSTLDIEPLLVTSSNSWAKTNMKATTANKEKGDLTGPFNIAVAITDNVDESDSTKNAKLVVIGNSTFASSDYVGIGGNVDLVVNSINWLQDRKDSISIQAKSLDDGTLNINAGQQLLISGIAVILIPLIIIIVGVRVWLRRRHQ